MGHTYKDALATYETLTSQESALILETHDEIIYRQIEPQLELLFQNISDESASKIAGIAIPVDPKKALTTKNDKLISEVRNKAFNLWVRRYSPQHRWVIEDEEIKPTKELTYIRRETAQSLIYALNNRLLSPEAELIITPVFVELGRIANGH